MAQRPLVGGRGGRAGANGPPGAAGSSLPGEKGTPGRGAPPSTSPSAPARWPLRPVQEVACDANPKRLLEITPVLKKGGV